VAAPEVSQVDDAATEVQAVLGGEGAVRRNDLYRVRNLSPAAR
jgi:hypothetical protein